MRRTHVFLAAALQLGAARAYAWDSWCHETFDQGGSCEAGPSTASARWVGPDANHGNADEHRRLLEWAFDAAKISPSARLLDVAIYTTRDDWIAPSPFERVTNRVVHSRGVSEFAQLPDFGYSLADWASQFATCPSQPGGDSIACHTFDHHMGALNSNHFVPQSKNFYGYYHALALTKAAECAFMAKTIGARSQEFSAFLQQCDSEALIVEAIGQHYLQDAWSSGHMWERWGSPEFADLPATRVGGSTGVFAGIVVGAIAGAIHGSETTWPQIPDALCSPDDDVRFVSGGGIHQGIGDLHRTELLSDSSFAYQRDMLLGCSSASLAEVYAASSHVMDPGYASHAAPPSTCFDQRATNSAMVAGFGNIDSVTGFVLLAIKAFAVPETTPDELHRVENEVNSELELLATRLEYLARANPDGTEAASGGLRPILGMKPNGSYPAATAATPASYVDAPLSWPVTPQGPSTPVQELAHLFSRGHASQWCSAMTEAELANLRTGARAAGAGSAKHALCVEYAQRHVRRRAPKKEPVPEVCPTDALAPKMAPVMNDGSPPPSLCELLSGGFAFVIDVDAEGLDTPGALLAEIWCSQTDEDAKKEEQHHKCEPKRPAFAGTAGIVATIGGGSLGGPPTDLGAGNNGAGNNGTGNNGTGNNGTGNNGTVPGAGNGPGTPGTDGTAPVGNPPPNTGTPAGPPGDATDPGCLWGFSQSNDLRGKCMEMASLDPNRPKTGALDAGDPHFLTLDGLHYDFQTRGDFVVVRSSDGLLEIQGRQAPFPTSCTNMAWNSAFAFLVSGNRVELYQSQAGAVYVDRMRQTVQPGGSVMLSGGGSVARDASLPLWVVRWPDGSRAYVSERAHALHLLFTPMPALRGTLTGLLGNFNGDPMEDLRNAAAAVIPVTAVVGHAGQFEVSGERLAAEFAQAWSVPAPRSLFSLVDGFEPVPAGSTSLFQDPKLEALQAALEVCEKAGVREGVWRDDCVQDVLCSSAEAAVPFVNAPPPALVARSDADSDRDGLDTSLEARFRTDKARADSDADGVFDGLEAVAKTDPLDAKDHPQARGERVAEVQPATTVSVEFAVPTSIERADVYLLIDLTGSMASSLANVRQNLSSAGGVIDVVRAAMPNAEFGVGAFTDYAHSLPVYQHFQDITGNVATVQQAVERLATVSAGDDIPEALFPALYAMTTGEGLGSMSRWPNPRTMSATFAPCGAGMWGWPCFRDGALPIAVAITDAPQHNGPNGQNAYATSLAAPAYGDVTKALTARGVKVVGVAVAPGAVPDLSAVATATGALDSSGAPLVSSGSGSVSSQVSQQIVSLARAPHDIGVVLADDPLDDIDTGGWVAGVTPSPLGNATLGCRAYPSLTDRDADGKMESFAKVQAGAPVCFSATLRVPKIAPADRPLAFALRAAVLADGAEVAARRVWLIVPPATGTPAVRVRDSVSSLLHAAM